MLKLTFQQLHHKSKSVDGEKYILGVSYRVRLQQIAI